MLHYIETNQFYVFTDTKGIFLTLVFLDICKAFNIFSSKYYNLIRKKIEQMNILILVLRIILGTILIIFGSNKFIGFIPDFEFANPDAGIFFGILADSYVLKTVGIVEVLVGLLLLTKKAVPFALIILAPISVNIILFHATLDPANIGPGALVFVTNAFLIFKFWSKYKTLF